MARKKRDDFKGAWHHVMHRGARKAPIFLVGDDCAYFTDTIGDVVRRFELEVHGFALMPNHYHLLVRSVHGNLSKCMKHINQSFTCYLNEKHAWDGPVFKGRFHSENIMNEWQLPYVLAYIHLNPLRANLITRIDTESWTSHRRYMGNVAYPKWLTTSFFLSLFDSPAALEAYMLGLHRGKTDWPTAMEQTSGLFKLKRTAKALTPDEARSDASSRAISTLRMIAEITGTSVEQIKRSQMGSRANPARRFAVWILGQDSAMTHKEIGFALEMTNYQVANVLRRLRNDKFPEFVGWHERWVDQQQASK